MAEDYPGIERRRFKRVEVSFTVVYRVNSPLVLRMKIGDKDIDALQLDISEDGMAVLTGYAVPTSAIIAVRFIMLDDHALSAEGRSRSIVVKGEVRYDVLLKQEKSYRLGIQFMGLSEADRNFIANFVKAR
jgi:c-di-GMP-binding flagellar brake protein YcgR